MSSKRFKKANKKLNVNHLKELTTEQLIYMLEELEQEKPTITNTNEFLFNEELVQKTYLIDYLIFDILTELKDRQGGEN